MLWEGQAEAAEVDGGRGRGAAAVEPGVLVVVMHVLMLMLLLIVLLLFMFQCVSECGVAWGGDDVDMRAGGEGGEAEVEEGGGRGR